MTPLNWFLVVLAAANVAVPVGAVMVDAPKSMASKVATDETGYVDVIIGEAGKDDCMVGVEVYSEAASDHPKDLDALATALDTDHTKPFEVLERAHKVKAGGKDVVRGVTKAGKGRLQRQTAFFVKKNAVVLSFYPLRREDACAALEESVTASARNK